MVPRLAVLVVLLLSQLATAQEVPAAEAKAETPGKAIRFEFNGLNLHGIDGGVGGKWWTSPHVALTVSLGFWNKNRSEDAVDDPQQESREFVDSAIRMSVGLEQHMRSTKNLSPYLGLFIGSGMNWREDTWTRHTDDDILRRETRTDTFSVHAGMSLGIEYFITENISLAGEHSFLFDRWSGTQESTDYETAHETDVSAFGVGFQTSGLMLSVYF
ncbi:hypothetical protein JXA88_16635 [Candidatus Fermentibacteria bacterium]|nr:hypothetical protein [Candidatus Fermentibacteria bacterium]